MKILVAGGAGYIGSRLVPHLAGLGHDVHVVDLLWFGNNLDPSVKLIKQDVFAIKPEELNGFDRVIFLAGLSNDPMAEYSPAMNFVANASAPAYFAYIAKQAGVKRFIYADSCSVYGFTNNKESTEEDAAQSFYPYGISKLQGELGVLQLKDENFSVICLRQGTVSGWSPRMRLDLIVNTMYSKAMTEGKITVNNPSIWRPIFAMSDLVRSYSNTIESDNAISGVFNVCSANYTVGEVADTVKKYFKERHGKEIAVQALDVHDFRNYKVSNKKASEILGIGFNGSVKSILEELDANLGKDFDFHNDKYHNISVFKKIFTS